MNTDTIPRPLTARQAEVYRYVWDFTLAHGYQPSMRDAMEAMGFKATNAMHLHLKALARKGWIAIPKGPHRARAVRFLYCPDNSPFTGLEPRKETT